MPLNAVFGWDALPAWIAILNGISAVLLVGGLYFIRHRRITAHRRCMLSAFVASALFLAVYVLHHWHAGIVYFSGQGWHRTLYFLVLGTHTPLAAIVPVLAIVTLTLALRGRFSRHRRWARWTWPIWMYVSLSGIAVYWMLYHP
ncbi:MAG TPA: DUF420 domain-containing protein [Terriglobales bacterium]|jgi:uncharacterized membrane protein YozB (DUF420 family)